MSDHPSDETIMASAPTDCTAVEQVDDLALLDISQMQKIYPCRRSPELRLTWEMFAARELSARQLDELCALKYALRKSGYAKFGPDEYQREFNVTTIKTARNRFKALLKLATEIELVEPWDFRTNRKKPRFLRLTQHAITFQWAELLDQFKQTLNQQHQDERDGDLDARDLRIWLHEQRASKSRKPGAVVPEVGSGLPETGISPAEIPCNDRAASPLNKRPNKQLDKRTNKTATERQLEEVVLQPVAEQRVQVPTAEQPTAITANSQIRGTANSQAKDGFDGWYSAQWQEEHQIQLFSQQKRAMCFVGTPASVSVGDMLWSFDRWQVGSVVMTKPGASEPLAFQGKTFETVLDAAEQETDRAAAVLTGLNAEPAYFELVMNGWECVSEDLTTVEKAIAHFDGNLLPMPPQLREYMKREQPERYQRYLQAMNESECVESSPTGGESAGTDGEQAPEALSTSQKPQEQASKPNSEEFSADVEKQPSEAISEAVLDATDENLLEAVLNPVGEVRNVVKTRKVPAWASFG